MRLSLHTVICCCVFTTVMPPTKGTTGEPNVSLKKSRFRVQSHMKRDLQPSLVTANEQYSDIHVRPQQDGHAKTLSPPSSFGLNIRPKRSPSKSGCVLVTCLYHDLVHRLYQINNKQKETTAPEKKMGLNGYGRRRRSLLDVTQLALQTGRQRWSTEAASKVSMAAEIEDNF